MNNPNRSNHWVTKFRNAFRGVGLGIHGESSFKVHFFFGVAVLGAGAAMRIDDLRQWCLLLLCIVVVLGAELFNSALERMARAISDRHDATSAPRLTSAAGPSLSLPSEPPWSAASSSWPGLASCSLGGDPGHGPSPHYS